MQGRGYVLAFEETVPTTWGVKTGKVNGAAAAWARPPNNAWELKLTRNPDAGGYNVELYDTRGGDVAGLYDGTTVYDSGSVPGAVRRLIERATGGQYRGRRHEMERSGFINDGVGLFDDLW